jgi:hypothetical protein
MILPFASLSHGHSSFKNQKLLSVPLGLTFQINPFGPYMLWDTEAILFIDYLEKNKTITWEYYSNLLTRLEKKFVKKEPVCKKKKSL